MNLRNVGHNFAICLTNSCNWVDIDYVGCPQGTIVFSSSKLPNIGQDGLPRSIQVRQLLFSLQFFAIKKPEQESPLFSHRLNPERYQMFHLTNEFSFSIH